MPDSSDWFDAARQFVVGSSRETDFIKKYTFFFLNVDNIYLRQKSKESKQTFAKINTDTKNMFAKKKSSKNLLQSGLAWTPHRYFQEQKHFFSS